MEKYPKYITTQDGYIGSFKKLEYGKFPVYSFFGGERVADNWEIENGCDDYEEIWKKSIELTNKGGIR